MRWCCQQAHRRCSSVVSDDKRLILRQDRILLQRNRFTILSVAAPVAARLDSHGSSRSRGGRGPWFPSFTVADDNCADCSATPPTVPEPKRSPQRHASGILGARPIFIACLTELRDALFISVAVVFAF